MALRIGELVAFIRADNDGFRRGTREAGRDMERLQRDVNGRLRDMRGRFVSEGRESGRRFGDGVGDGDRGMSRLGRMARRVLSSVGSQFAAAGQQGSEMAQNITGKSGPVPALLMLGAIMHALPIAAQLASIGVTLGIGGGLAAMGIMVAAKNEQVKASFADLASHVKNRLTQIARPFEGELKKVAAIAKGTFDKFAPYLERSFAKIAPTVSRFAAGLASGVMKLGPVIEGVSTHFVALMQVLSGRMPDLLGALGSALGKISNAADPTAFNTFINVLVDLINVSAWSITKLSQLGAFLLQQYGVWRSFATLNFQGVKDSLRGLTTQFVDFGDKEGYAARQADAMNRKLAETANKALAARGSMRSLEQAIDDAADSVKKNGRTLDIHTAKGRANQAALDGIASQALAMAQAMKDSGRDSSGAMERARAAFIRVARQMGLNKAAAAALATKLGLVPDKKTTKYAGVGAEGATTKARELKKAIDRIPNTKTTIYQMITHDATRKARELSASPQAYGSGTYAATYAATAQATAKGFTAGLTAGLLRGVPTLPAKLRKLLYKPGQAILRGLRDGMGRSADQVRDEAARIADQIRKAFAKTAKKTKVDDFLLAALKRTTAKLVTLANKREKILEKIAEARQFAADVTSGARSFAGLTGLDFRDAEGDQAAPTAQGIRAGLAGKLATLKQFAANIRKLAAKGLGKGLLRQLLEAGPEAGGPLAAALAAADSATFGAIQAAQKEIDAVSNNLGRMGADLLYDSGRGAAKGFLRGLIDQQREIERQMQKVANNFARQIAKALGIKVHIVDPKPPPAPHPRTNMPKGSLLDGPLIIENYHEAPRGSARGTAEQLLFLTKARG